MKRYLIINADDYGISPGVNRAIEEAFQCGAVTSASCFADKFVAIPEPMYGRCGVHLEAPNGATALASELQKTWMKQIERFLARSKYPPTHFDTHHHVHANEQAFKIYLELCASYGVACVPFASWQAHDARRVGVSCADHSQIRWIDGQRLTLERLLKVDFAWARTVHLMTHPGYVDDDLRHQSSMTFVRECEFEVLTDPSFDLWLRSEGIEKVGMNAL